MGCGETKDQLPTLLGFFETGREDQKEYCIKLKDSFKHEKAIRFEIKSSPGMQFSIKFRHKGIIHDIQTTFNDSEMESSLDKMYKILDGNK